MVRILLKLLAVPAAAVALLYLFLLITAWL